MRDGTRSLSYSLSGKDHTADTFFDVRLSTNAVLHSPDLVAVCYHLTYDGTYRYDNADCLEQR